MEFAADGHPLGAEFTTDRPPEITVRVAGTAPLESVQVRRGLETVYEHSFSEGGAGREEIDPGRVRVLWSGARLKGRFRHAVWNGGLVLTKGRILTAEPYGFDNPREGIVETTETRVSWRSNTSGDPDGVILTLDAPADAALEFDAGGHRLTIPLGELGAESRVWPLGPVEKRVEARRMPRPRDLGPREVRFSFREDELEPGCHPYWLRVLQWDNEMAWAGPVFVNVA